MVHIGDSMIKLQGPKQVMPRRYKDVCHVIVATFKGIIADGLSVACPLETINTEEVHPSEAMLADIGVDVFARG